MTTLDAEFETAVTLDDCRRFAELSQDWNSLHTDTAHAAASAYGRQVLHGAFSAGLLSRLAGMFLPGKDCLLYGMGLRFVSPILPPARLFVRGRIVSGSAIGGRVAATVSDATSGTLYVDGSYEFGLHRMAAPASITENPNQDAPAGEPVVLVTGASGGLGGAMLRMLAARAVAAPRSPDSQRLEMTHLEAGALGNRPIAAIVHCGWPIPDNRKFIEIEDPDLAIAHNVAAPIRDVQLLAALLAKRGMPNAPLILVGSTFADPGRHYFRMPLYSIAKSAIPTMVRILALELAPKGMRCFGVVFDVLDGGMNKGITPSARVANADRSPWGELGTPDDAAGQIGWMLDNQSKLVSGAMLTLSAGALP
ncbi:MAG: SDR family oxidoreductase [Gemmatimonadaceae bacterium]